MNEFFKAVLGITVMMSGAFAAQAQFGGMTPSGVNSAFLKVFGAHTNFSATVDTRVLDKEGKDWVRVPISLAAMDQKIAMEVDLAKAVSRDLPELALASLKQAGMSEVTSIMRPDKKATYVIYPGAKSYVSMPLSTEEAQTLDKGYKVQSETVGKELLAGKERSKHTVVVRDSKGATVLEATTWNAPELKDFPVQIETRQDAMTIIMRFSNLKLEKPGTAQFEVPQGFTQYKNVQELMFEAMKKIAAGAAK